MSCPHCGGYGFVVTLVPVWEDYAPHGGFWTEDTREDLCSCPAGAAAEAQLKEMAEKAKSDAALADILARYIAIAQDPEYQARRQAEAEVKQLSKRR